jgi:Cys-tRNA(Pro)/Cys-tRNA(Cys) deacylase
MMDTDRAQRLTGYVVGGISPFGQKRSSPTVIDDSAHDHETVFVSAGRRGLDVEITPFDLIALLRAKSAHIAA